MHAQEIDQAFFDQQAPFVRAVEQLTHGDGGAAHLADMAEVFDIFRGQDILQEEQLELFHILGEFDRIDWAQALVDIVQQFHFFTHWSAHIPSF